MGVWVPRQACHRVIHSRSPKFFYIKASVDTLRRDDTVRDPHKQRLLKRQWERL